MKKIIVPIDFSDYCEHALETAAFIAKKYKAEIIVVHMLELSSAIINQYESYSHTEAALYLKLARKKINKFLEKDYLKGLIVRSMIKNYKISNELNELSNKENADLIIMGSKGVSGLKEMFVGSNTEKVVRNSEIPVLVVKNVSVTDDFKSAVFASNFEEEDIKPYLEARKFLDSFGCKIYLLHVNTPYNNFLTTTERHEKVTKFLTKAEDNLKNIDSVYYVSNHTIEQGILDYSNINGIDLIIMSTHGRKGILRFFEGSITEDVANHSTLPVITFKI